MTRPDFDEPIDRRGTLCNKWDDLGSVFGMQAPDALAMWVADMDFRAPAAVRRARRWSWSIRKSFTRLTR